MFRIMASSLAVFIVVNGGLLAGDKAAVQALRTQAKALKVSKPSLSNRSRHAITPPLRGPRSPRRR